MRKLEDLELITKAAIHFKGKWPDGYEALIVSTKSNDCWGEGTYQDFTSGKESLMAIMNGSNFWLWVCSRVEFEGYIKILSDNAPKVATHYLPNNAFYYIKENHGYTLVNEYGIQYHAQLDESAFTSLIPLPVPEPTPWTPEVGHSCQVLWYNDWHDTFIVGKDSDGDFVYETSDFSEIGSFEIADNTTEFRPIPSENEVDLVVDDEECPYYKVRGLGDQLHNIVCELQDEPIADELENIVHKLWNIMKPSPEEVEIRNKLYYAVSSLGEDLSDIQVNSMVNFIIECKEKPQTSKPVG